MCRPMGILSREVFAGKPVVDDDHRLPLGVIGGGKGAAGENRNFHGPEEIGSNNADVFGWFITLGYGPAFELDGNVNIVSRKRNREPGRNGLYARESSQASEQPVIEIDSLVARIAVQRQTQIGGEDVVRIEARIDVEHPNEATDQQAGAYQQHQPQRSFGDQQPTL